MSLTATLWYCYHMTMMKRKFDNKHDTIAKVTFICLALLLCGFLFATGSIASEHCGEYSHSGIQSFDESMTVCDVCRNSEHSQKQCHNQCSLPIDLPKVALASNGGAYSDTYSLAVSRVKILGRISNPERNPLINSVEKTCISPPIFLQNESFLI